MKTSPPCRGIGLRPLPRISTGESTVRRVGLWFTVQLPRGCCRYLSVNPYHTRLLLFWLVASQAEPPSFQSRLWEINKRYKTPITCYKSKWFWHNGKTEVMVICRLSLENLGQNIFFKCITHKTIPLSLWAIISQSITS